MNYRERFITFDCANATCVGVLAMPAHGIAQSRCGVVIVVGGPQYRVGSHRQFAHLARALATHGIPALRFDYRGMGDSDGEARTFETIDGDVRSAVDTLIAQCGVDRVALWGLCDGATASLMYAWRDPRIAGIVALNPWARSAQGEAAARLKHYYVQRLASAEFWHKLVSGRFEMRKSMNGFAANVRGAVKGRPVPAQSFLQRMEDGWRRFRRPMLVVLSGNDLTAREFEDWAAADPRRHALMKDALTETAVLTNADHTFSEREGRDAVAARTVEWVSRLAARA